MARIPMGCLSQQRLEITRGQRSCEQKPLRLIACLRAQEIGLLDGFHTFGDNCKPNQSHFITARDRILRHNGSQNLVRQIALRNSCSYLPDACFDGDEAVLKFEAEEEAFQR